MLVLVLTMAITAPVSPPLQQCLRDAHEIPLDMATCYIAERERWQHRLDAAASRIAAVLSPSQRRTMAREQARWGQDRDRKCRRDGEVDRGGSQEGADIAMCAARATRVRALELEHRVVTR